jgi:hypothetical protein
LVWRSRAWDSAIAWSALSSRASTAPLSTRRPRSTKIDSMTPADRAYNAASFST